MSVDKVEAMKHVNPKVDIEHLVSDCFDYDFYR